MAIHLNRREKYAVFLTAGLLVILAVFELVVSPFFQEKTLLERKINAQTELMPKLYRHYETLKANRRSSKAGPLRKKDFTLFSFLDQLVRKAGIKDNLQFMKPSTAMEKNGRFKISLVEMKLQALTMEQLTKYLYMVETSPNGVTVTRLSISKTGKPEGFVNVVLQVETRES